jgi:UDP-N-acetylmuramoyl-tripeptide--D-alanyl-D-alanine ligase
MDATALPTIAAACGGVLLGAGTADITAISKDTRTLRAGDLYWALVGENFDGHEFAAAAAEAGAAGAVVSREPADLPDGFPLIKVDDTQAALHRLAAWHRDRLKARVVCLTGSNGKTSTKDFSAAVASTKFTVSKTEGNLNNHIGVPLTLLRLEPQHRHAVIEMGANHAGDVTELAGFAQPTIGLVTNAGAEHLEGFGSLEAAARAEGELFAALPTDGVAVINADDPFAGMWREMTVARIVTFGLGSKVDFSARDIHTATDRQGFVTCFVIYSRSSRMFASL